MREHGGITLRIDAVYVVVMDSLYALDAVNTSCESRMRDAFVFLHSGGKFKTHRCEEITCVFL